MQWLGSDGAAWRREFLQSKLTRQHVIEILAQQIIFGDSACRREHGTYTAFCRRAQHFWG